MISQRYFESEGESDNLDLPFFIDSALKPDIRIRQGACIQGYLNYSDANRSL